MKLATSASNIKADRALTIAPMTMPAMASPAPANLPSVASIRRRTEIPDQSARGPSTSLNGQSESRPTIPAASAVLAAGSYVLPEWTVKSSDMASSFQNLPAVRRPIVAAGSAIWVRTRWQTRWIHRQKDIDDSGEVRQLAYGEELVRVLGDLKRDDA